MVRFASFLIVALFATVGFAEPRQVAKPRPIVASAANKPSPAPDSKPSPAPNPVSPPVRTVKYGDHDVLPLNTRVGFDTMVLLPAGETIIEAAIGDADHWVVNVSQNMAHIKPSAPDLTTNLNLISSRSVVYSFYLKELAGQEPDLKVIVEAKDAILQALQGGSRYVPVEQLDAVRQDNKQLRDQIAAAQVKSQTDVDQQKAQWRNQWLNSLRFDYQWDKTDKSAFPIDAIFTDGRNTYIKTPAAQSPASLYELREGKPALANFAYLEGGLYMTSRVVDQGYLTVGSKKITFHRKEK
jgi:type IV secretion system protein VirB9